MQRHSLVDPIKGRFYEYVTRDDKEERLLEALQLAVKDECPPNMKDYVCMSDEAEEQDCEACLLRYATADFGKPRKN